MDSEPNEQEKIREVLEQILNQISIMKEDAKKNEDVNENENSAKSIQEIDTGDAFSVEENLPEGVPADTSWKCNKRRKRFSQSNPEIEIVEETNSLEVQSNKHVFIDLDDLSSSEDEVEVEDDDDDCLILDKNPFLDEDETLNTHLLDEELELTKETGTVVACRDFPHARSNCAKFLFSKTRHREYCKLCHCYVCDVVAPCCHWGNGLNEDDHCHATEIDIKWRMKRNSQKRLMNFKHLDSGIQTMLENMNHHRSLYSKSISHSSVKSFFSPLPSRPPRSIPTISSPLSKTNHVSNPSSSFKHLSSSSIVERSNSNAKSTRLRTNAIRYLKGRGVNS